MEQRNLRPAPPTSTPKPAQALEQVFSGFGYRRHILSMDDLINYMNTGGKAKSKEKLRDFLELSASEEEFFKDISDNPYSPTAAKKGK